MYQKVGIGSERSKKLCAPSTLPLFLFLLPPSFCRKGIERKGREGVEGNPLSHCFCIGCFSSFLSSHFASRSSGFERRQKTVGKIFPLLPFSLFCFTFTFAVQQTNSFAFHSFVSTDFSTNHPVIILIFVLINGALITLCDYRTTKMGKANDGKPKGRMSAYAYFVQTCREEHKKKHPNENVVFAEFSRKCADRWKVSVDSLRLQIDDPVVEI